MTRLVAASLLVIALGAPAAAQLPQARLYSLFPPGAQAGTEVEVTITGGEDLDEIDSLYFTHPGITAQQKMQGDKPVDKAFVVSVKSDVPPGTYEVAAAGRFGGTNTRRFIVSDRSEVAGTEANNTAAEASALELGTVVNGRLEGGADLDWYSFSAQQGQRLVFTCAAETIDSRMEPLLEVFQADGRRRLANVRSIRGEDAVLAFDVPETGEYRLLVRDYTFRNGNEYFYRLIGHTGPHIAFVMPPAGTLGASTHTLYGYNLPEGERTDWTINGVALERVTRTFDLPPDAVARTPASLRSSVSAGMDAVFVSVDSDHGRSNSVPIFVTDSPVVLAQEPNDEPAAAQVVSVPCDIGGQFSQAGDVDYFRFDAKQGQVLYIETYAERIGSTADPFLIVEQVTVDGAGAETVKRLSAQDDIGTNLYQNVFDTQTDDAVFKLDVPADGIYQVSLRDRAWEVRGDPSLVYRLAIRPEQPDFRVVAVPVAPAAGQTWPIGLRRGDNFPVNVLVFRQDGFNGAIDVTAENLPAGITCSGTSIGPGETLAPVILSASDDLEATWHEIAFVARARIDDPAAQRAVTAAQQSVTASQKPLPDLRKAVEATNQKVQEATAARDQAKAASDAKPDDEGLKNALAKAEEALTAAQAAHTDAAEKLKAAETVVATAEAALAEAVKHAHENARDVSHPVRYGGVVWSAANNAPAVARLAQTFATSVIPEPAPFQVKTDVFRVDANQSRQILVPITLEKRNEFNEKVALNFAGVPKNANIDVANGAVEKDQSESLLRIFVKDNSPPGVYTLWLNTQGQVAYARNPENAERLKAAHEAVVAEHASAQATAQAATTAKTEATQKATAAAEVLKKAQTDKTAAEQALKQAQTIVATETKSKTDSDTVVTTATTALNAAKEQLTAATKALEQAEAAVTAAADAAKKAADAAGQDPNNEDLKKQQAEAEAALKQAEQTRDTAKTELAKVQEAQTKAQQAVDAASKAQAVAVEKLKAAEIGEKATTETLKAVEEELKVAETANQAAADAKAAADKADADAQAAAKALDDKRKAAEKAATDAANAAKPQNKNFTPPSTPIVITVKPSPAKLAANVPDSGNLKRGASIEIKVTVTRQNDFAGPVTLTLPVPPGVAGVSAENVTIPADQNEGTLVVAAAGDATEGQLANMVVRATMDFDGKAAVDVPVAIKVNP